MTITVKYSVELRQPIEQVFQTATDLACLPHWSSVREIRHVSGLPLKIGTTFQLVSHLGGQDRLVECKVTTFQAPHKFGYVSEGPGKSEISFDLQPIGDRTQLVYTVSITVNAMFEPLIRGEVDRQAKNDLDRLVTLLTQAR